LTNETQNEADLLTLAESLLARGEHSGAESAFLQLLGQDAQNVDALTGIGSIALQAGRLDAAHRLLSQALSIAPTSSKVHRLIGDYFDRNRDHSSALRHYEEAARLDSAAADAGSRLNATQESLGATRESIGILQDPDYGRGTNMPWDDGDWIWAERNEKPTLLVLFAGLGVGNNPPTFIFYNFLKDFPQVDKLFVRDLSRRWYLDGLGDLARNVEETSRLLSQRMADYDRTVFVGSSAGGMAAILYGELTGAHKVLSFAPQTVLTEAKEREIGDERWPRLMKKLRSCDGARQFLDLNNMAPFSTAIDIHYAVNCEHDKLHAQRIAGNRVTCFPHEDAQDHMLAMHLRDTGLLKKLFEAEID